MADCGSREEIGCRHVKTAKLEETVEPKPASSSTIYGRLRKCDPEKDEYMRQFLLFHYQFHRTKGFGIEWDKFDYFFNLCNPHDGAPPIPTMSNQEDIMEPTLLAISKTEPRQCQ
ncbi:unnamed protein product [Cochlearia groenlandica]